MMATIVSVMVMWRRLVIEQMTNTDHSGENGQEANATIFDIYSTLVPVIDIHTRDNGDNGEMFGSPLSDNPAWLR